MFHQRIIQALVVLAIGSGVDAVSIDNIDFCSTEFDGYGSDGMGGQWPSIAVNIAANPRGGPNDSLYVGPEFDVLCPLPSGWYVFDGSFQFGYASAAVRRNRIRGPVGSQAVFPINLSISTPGVGTTPFGSVMADARPPGVVADSPKFDGNPVFYSMGAYWLVSGKATNILLANARLEYWSGSEWLPVTFYGSSPFSANAPGDFFARIPRTGQPPLIRVFSTTAPPDRIGWATSTGPQARVYEPLRAPIRTPSGPNSRFRIKTRTVTMGVRG